MASIIPNKKDFLQVNDLEVIYTSNKKIVQAVNKVSFSMDKGETLALVGETGAGKTTICRSILRILPNPPAKQIGGEIIMDGENLTQMSEENMLKVRGAKAAMIFQDPMTALNPVMQVGKQIVEGLMLHNDYTVKQAEERAREMFELVGIAPNRMQEYPFEFSGGMKQRVVIAMALACNPELLLADEPTTALDVTIQAQVMDLISELRAKYNTAMILVTHDLGLVAQNCDNVAIVYSGKIIEYGTKQSIFMHPTHPYTIGLFGALPSMNNDAPRLTPIHGTMPDPTNLPAGCAFAPRCQYAEDACRSGEMPLNEIATGHYCRCIKRTKEE
jgi:peptide/nickel transport system ATP-binding protein